jgi:nicotinamidase-related amidase
LEKGGFGDVLGNDISKVQRAIEPCKKILEAARKAELFIIHTREGHRGDMSDVHPHKNNKRDADGNKLKGIGEPGPMGRILIRGEPGHDIIPELYPIEGEPVVDKPGKGSFYATDLECMLHAKQITTLLVCGVTTEVCVHTTIREANDRGFHCVCVSDCCASYRDDFHNSALQMIYCQNGLFGSVTDSEKLLKALEEAA